jgi:hypothetical protein
MVDFDLRRWVEYRLLHADAIRICEHHNVLISNENATAVQNAVHVARLAPFPSITQDGAELALLEVFLSLPGACPQCNQP